MNPPSLRLAATALVLAALPAFADHVTANPTVAYALDEALTPHEFGIEMHAGSVSWSAGCGGGAEEGEVQVSLVDAAGGSFKSVAHVREAGSPSGTTVVAIDPGQALRARVSATCCSDCNNLGVHTVMKSVETELVVRPLVLAAPPAFVSVDPVDVYECLPVGQTVKAAVSFRGRPNETANERVRIVLRGAGVDIDIEESAFDAHGTELSITATEAGTVDYHLVHQPYGVVSNRVTLKADATGCKHAPGEPPEEVEEETSGGCAAAPGGLAAALALALPAFRRRRA